MSRKKTVDARYRLARETGTVIKDWGGRLPFALVYPNSYYIGMSNLGIHALYSQLNGYNSAVCERFFYEAPGDKPVTPLSLESQRPFPDFPVIGFSVTYELDFFNVVGILQAAGIPLYSADRDERHPILIAGGPCVTANPAPLSPFFDCMAIGEAEAIIPSVLPVLENGIGEDRDTLLKELARIPGIYVPRFPPESPVQRQFVKDLDNFPTHTVILTPDTELGNLYLVEAERGCSHGCRFCMVGTIFSPARYRSLESILEQAEEGLKHRKRIGLVGPSVSDHPQFDEILSGLRDLSAEISVSSLRIKPLPESGLAELAQGRAKTIALAPEAGSQRLRSFIRKGINGDDILAAMHRVAEHGFRQLKLYFMVGLPSETDDDIEELAALTLKCKEILDERRSGCRITLSVAPFVPKPGTPFERQPMEDLPVLNHRISTLKKTLEPSGISVKADSPGWSRVQGVLAQGDMRLAEVLADIEDISLPGWRKALEKHGMDESRYLRAKPENEKLPWDAIDHHA